MSTRTFLEKERALAYVRRFYESVRNWEEIEKDPEKKRDAFLSGMKALEAIEKGHIKKLRKLRD